MKKNRMKAILVLVVIAALIFTTLIPCMVAFAADDTTGNQLLVIDSENIYQGMDKSYAYGYQPKVYSDAVQVVLPLKDSTGTTLANKDITISVNLGDTSTSPFVYKNYDRTISQNTYAVIDSGGNSATIGGIYCIDLALALNQNKVNGNYPVVINASYINGTETVVQSFTVYVNIANGIDPNATATPSPTPTPTPSQAPESQPKVIVSRYHVNPDIVLAGSTFSVDLSLKNTSTTKNVKNIVVTYKGETSDLMPESETNTFYVSKIAKDTEHTFNFSMNVRADVKPAPQKIILTINYEDENAQQLSATDEILVQIKQPIRTKFDQPTVPTQVFVGDSVSASLNMYNLGKNILYNVMVVLEANGFAPEGSAYLGNMESGSQKSAEIYAAVEDMQGIVDGKFIVTYEDEYGETYTEEVPFASEILPMQVMEEYPTDMPVEEVQTGMPVWGWALIIGGGAVAGIIVWRVLKKKKAAKLEKEDEDDLD